MVLAKGKKPFDIKQTEDIGMKIIEVAREQKDLLNEGIAYIALWQQATANGRRSWFTEDFFPADSNAEEPVFDDEQKARLAEIARLDSDAVLLNGYYHAWIGSADEPLKAADISIGLKQHYEQHNALVSGYLAEDVPPAEDEQETGIDTITIEIPFTSCGDLTAAKGNLAALLQSKATLIKAALGGDGTGNLPIEFTDSTVKFEWFKFGADGSVLAAWEAFLCAAVKFAKKAKRVTAKDAAVENEQFHFRAFLVRIGMNDAENKTHRKLLLRNLAGDAAFATAASKERWLAKHGSKKTEEAAENDNAE